MCLNPPPLVRGGAGPLLPERHAVLQFLCQGDGGSAEESTVQEPVSTHTHTLFNHLQHWSCTSALCWLSRTPPPPRTNVPRQPASLGSADPCLWLGLGRGGCSVSSFACLAAVLQIHAGVSAHTAHWPWCQPHAVAPTLPPPLFWQVEHDPPDCQRLLQPHQEWHGPARWNPPGSVLQPIVAQVGRGLHTLWCHVTWLKCICVQFSSKQHIHWLIFKYFQTP